MQQKWFASNIECLLVFVRCLQWQCMWGACSCALSRTPGEDGTTEQTWLWCTALISKFFCLSSVPFWFFNIVSFKSHQFHFWRSSLHRCRLCPIRETITSRQMLSPWQVWTLNLKSGHTSCTASPDKTAMVTTADQVRGKTFSMMYLVKLHGNKTNGAVGVTDCWHVLQLLS